MINHLMCYALLYLYLELLVIEIFWINICQEMAKRMVIFKIVSKNQGNPQRVILKYRVLGIDESYLMTAQNELSVLWLNFFLDLRYNKF